MMTCERGYYVRMAKLNSPEAEHSADHYFDLREKKSQRREEEAEAKAPVTYLDYQQVNLYISRFYQARNTSDRDFYKNKLVEIKKVYGEWLDPSISEKLNKAIRGL